MKKQRIKNLINGIVALSCVALFMFLFLTLTFSYQDDVFTIIASVFAGVLVILLLNSLVHETGHVLFGVFSGLKFYSVKFLWLFIGKKEGKLKVLLESSDGEIGSTVLVPKSPEKVFEKYVLSAFGGLLFTFLLITAQVLICLFCKNLIIYSALGITFPITVYVFLINLFPLFENNDGYIVYAYLSGGKLKTVCSNYFTATAWLYAGVEPSELDSTLLLDHGVESPYFSNVRYLRYLAYVNSDEERAVEELRQISDLSKLSFCVDEVYEELLFCALLIGDEKFIKAHENEVIKIISKQERPQSFRVHASLRINDKDIEWAKLILESGIKFCDTYAVKGIAKSEKRYMKFMLDNL